MEHDPLAVRIYELLDTFTGGIERFLDEVTDDGYTSSAYNPFTCVTLYERRIEFGFWTEMGGDLCPDPVFVLTLGDGVALLETLEIRQLISLPGHTLTRADAEYCAEFLEEMCQRKQHGVMVPSHHVTYNPPQEVRYGA